MPRDLQELITESVDASAADAWSKFTVGEADKLVLHEAALKVLKVFPGRMPGQCGLMSALYSLALEKLGSQRGYVVAGSLYIGDKRVFGEDKGFDDKERFSESIPRDSIRKVWIAALSATAGFMVERRKLDQNPFLGIRVRDEDAAENAEKEQQQKGPPRKGFTPEEAKRILTATLVAPSDFISVEMAAARRWLPWLCAYSGARVNELTSLHPDDIKPYADGTWCMVIKPSREKTAQWRVVPIHSHVIEQNFGQKFLDYVEERRKLQKPLFYDPVRRRGGTVRHPQFHKVAERVGEWVYGLGIPIGIRPSHGWRHVFKSMARHVGMDREVEGFITGHRPKDAGSGNDYGDRWVQTMSAEIEKYPRYEIPALNQLPVPHKRHRRTNAEVSAAKAAKADRKAARAARAPGVAK